MKTKTLFLIFISIFIGLFITGTVIAQGGFWLPDASNNLEPLEDTMGLKIPSLTNCDTIDTDGSGNLSCGTDDGGGAGLWTDDGAFTYLTATGDDVVFGASSTSGAPFYMDVSAGDLTVSGNFLTTGYGAFDLGLAVPTGQGVVSGDMGTDASLLLLAGSDGGVIGFVGLIISGSSDNMSFSNDAGDTITFAPGYIVDSTGAIDFGNENLTTTGYIGLKSNAELRFYDNGNYVGFEAPALSANQIWVLPNADGNADEAMGTDASGNLSWTSYVLTAGDTMTGFLTLNADPTANLHAVTKEYVDMAVGFYFDYFFNNTGDSGIGGIYYEMTDVDLGEAESDIDSAVTNGADDQALVNFITLAGEPGIEQLEAGIYDVHFHAAKTAGNSTVDGIYAELWKRTTAPAETLLATTETTGEIDGKRGWDIHMVLDTPVTIDLTDRLVIKFYANTGSGGGSGSTVTLYQEGDSVSHFTFQTTSGILSNIFIRRDGTVGLTDDWNAGSFDITANNFIGTAATADAFTNNGTNCNAGEYPLGVDNVGAVESCTDATTEINSVVNGLGGTNLTCSGQSCNVDDSFLINSGSDIAGSGSGFTWAFDASAGVDSVFTFGNGTIDVTTGAFQVGGNAVLTGNESITLSGDVSGSGATSINVSVTDFTIGGQATGDMLFYNGSNWDNLAKGNEGEVLTSVSGLPDWEAGGAGDVTKVGTPVNNQLGIWTGDGTIEGHIGLTWDDSNLSATAFGGITEANLVDKSASETMTGIWEFGRYTTFTFQDDTENVAPFVRFNRAKAGGADVVDGNYLGEIRFWGMSNGGYQSGANIIAVADGDVGGATDMPSKLIFQTSPDGSATPVTRLTIGSDGVVTFTETIAGSITGNAATVTGFTPAGGSLILAGADAVTITTTGATNSTLPLGTKTLVATDVATLSSLTSIGTIGTGTWNALFSAGLIDGDDINSNIAGRSLTLSSASPDTLDADPELYQYMAKIAFEDPTATDDFFFDEIGTSAVTFTSIYCKTLVGTAEIDISIAGTDINGTDISCTTSGVLDSSLGGDTSGATGEEVKLLITSVASAPTYIMVILRGTYDD